MKSLFAPDPINPRSICARAARLGAWLLLAALPATADTPTYYWDTDDSNPGAGYPLDGNWDNVTPNWTTDPTGSSPAFPYTNRANVYFAATGDSPPDSDWTAVGSYTVTMDGIIPVSDIQIEDGNPCTIVATPPGYLDKDTPAISVLNSGQWAYLYAPIASAAGTSNGITIWAGNTYGPGTLVLGSTNSYLGPTTIAGGTLQLAGPQLLPNASPLVISNMDMSATLATGGFSQTLGSLSVTGANGSVTLDLGNGPGTLAFADSHLQSWNGMPVTILNYSNGVSALRFGTNRAGLTATQLSLIQFEYPQSGSRLYVPARIDANGFVTPTSPPILSITPSGLASRVVTWSAVSGASYILHYKENLTDSAWSNVGQAVTAGGSTVSVTNSVGSYPRGFYWVEPQPQQHPD